MVNVPQYELVRDTFNKKEDKKVWTKIQNVSELNNLFKVSFIKKERNDTWFKIESVKDIRTSFMIASNFGEGGYGVGFIPKGTSTGFRASKESSYNNMLLYLGSGHSSYQDKMRMHHAVAKMEFGKYPGSTGNITGVATSILQESSSKVSFDYYPLNIVLNFDYQNLSNQVIIEYSD